jgi:hypothetical protein
MLTSSSRTRLRSRSTSVRSLHAQPFVVQSNYRTFTPKAFGGMGRLVLSRLYSSYDMERFTISHHGPVSHPIKCQSISVSGFRLRQGYGGQVSDRCRSLSFVASFVVSFVDKDRDNEGTRLTEPTLHLRVASGCSAWKCSVGSQNPSSIHPPPPWMLNVECWLLSVESGVLAEMTLNCGQTEGFNIQHSTLNHQYSTERPDLAVLRPPLRPP